VEALSANISDRANRERIETIADHRPEHIGFRRGQSFAIGRQSSTAAA